MVDVCQDIKALHHLPFPMTEVQAALGSQLLKRVDKLNSRRI